MSAPPCDARSAGLRLACLPDMSPARLWALLDTFGVHVSALAAVAEGRAHEADAREGRRTEITPGLARRWRTALASGDIERLLAGRAPHVWLAPHGGTDPEYPIAEMSNPPAVLLSEGAVPGVLRRRRVAVVGTRSASVHGLHDATALGAALADAGVTVVSGMALGIDGAAHRGALEAGGGVVGVVATGLDIEYPRRHRTLYEQVREAGVLVSEVGYGVGPTPARFPIRNRIIAALADVVVVVEATSRGGARITADHAIRYGRPVLAMPGSRRNPAAEGCNALIADGAHPLLEPSDVLVALGLTEGSARARWHTTPPPLSGDAGRVVSALAGDPASNDELRERLGWSANTLALALSDAETGGHILRAHGRWWPV
ncbi:MAG: DNA-processing protein DprA [Acidimicrobiia bacterium]|nr:DNA-processing protein DprA [Acidimicrobiia bacterium]